MNIENLIIPISEEHRDYLHDETKTVGTAQSISFPKSETEISALLHHFSEKGERVTVQGNRTGLTAASVPGGGHIMSLSHMDALPTMPFTCAFSRACLLAYCGR